MSLNTVQRAINEAWALYENELGEEGYGKGDFVDFVVGALGLADDSPSVRRFYEERIHERERQEPENAALERERAAALLAKAQPMQFYDCKPQEPFSPELLWMGVAEAREMNPEQIDRLLKAESTTLRAALREGLLVALVKKSNELWLVAPDDVDAFRETVLRPSASHEPK